MEANLKWRDEGVARDNFVIVYFLCLLDRNDAEGIAHFQMDRVLIYAEL